MKHFKPVIFGSVLTVMQISALSAAIMLEYLSTKRMGVMRYLVFKRRDYESTIFTPHLTILYKIFLAIGALGCCILATYCIHKRWCRRTKTLIVQTLIVNMIGVAFCSFVNIQQLMAYYFFLMAVFIIVVLQYIKLTFKLVSELTKKAS